MDSEAGVSANEAPAPCSEFRAWRGLSNCEDPGSEPGSGDLGAAQIKLTFGRRSWRPDAMIPHAGGRAREGEANLLRGVLSHATKRFAHPDRPRLIRPRRLCFLILSLGREVLSYAYQVIGFMIAPSMSSPALTYFHKATRSLRASAVIIDFLRALVAPTSTRAEYQRAKADCG